MFKKILVAVDGSKSSFKAMDKAIELQKLMDTEIYLICVYKHHSLFEASLSIGRPDSMDIPAKVLSEYAIKRVCCLAACPTASLPRRNVQCW